MARLPRPLWTLRVGFGLLGLLAPLPAIAQRADSSAPPRDVSPRGGASDGPRAAPGSGGGSNQGWSGPIYQGVGTSGGGRSVDVRPGRDRSAVAPIRTRVAAGDANRGGTGAVDRPGRGGADRGGKRDVVRTMARDSLGHYDQGPIPYGHHHRFGPAPSWLFYRHQAFFGGLNKHSFIPTQKVDPATNEIVDQVWWHQSAMSYGILMPPGGKLVVELDHPNLGWIHHSFVGKWGSPEPGMLMNLIKFNGAPAVCTNPTDKPKYVYLVVSDPTGMTFNNPYRLTLNASWKPDTLKGIDLPIAKGIWSESWIVDSEF